MRHAFVDDFGNWIRTLEDCDTDEPFRQNQWAWSQESQIVVAELYDALGVEL